MTTSMRDLMTIVESAGTASLPPRLFHATYMPYLESILQHGLGAVQGRKNWSDSVDGVVYLADSLEVAISYAETSETAPDEYLDQIVVLSVDTARLTPARLFPDSNVIEGTSTFEYHGVIPAAAITVTNEETTIAEATGYVSEAEVLDFDPRKSSLLFDLDMAANRNAPDPKQIAAFKRLLARDASIRLYHGTSVRHDVWDKGLLPTSASRRRSIQSGPGFVYLTYDPMRALTFAQMGYPGEGPYVVYSVVVPVKSLKADPDQLKNKRMWGERPDIGTTLIDSLIHGAGARVKGHIETWRIKVHGYFDKSGNRVEKPDTHVWGDDQYR